MTLYSGIFSFCCRWILFHCFVNQVQCVHKKAQKIPLKDTLILAIFGTGTMLLSELPYIQRKLVIKPVFRTLGLEKICLYLG